MYSTHACYTPNTQQAAEQSFRTQPRIDLHTHHVFLVLLEVCVDEEAPGGINQGVLHVINALIPAWSQGGGSRGYLVGCKREVMQGDIVSPFNKKKERKRKIKISSSRSDLDPTSTS